MSETGVPSQQEKTSADEIRELEHLLSEKKRALAEAGTAHDDKETFRQVFKEKYSELPSSTTQTSTGDDSGDSSVANGVGTSPQKPLSDDLARRGADLKKKQREEQLSVLIDISFEKGVAEAVGLARAMTPWLIDELHDRLADEYYQKLKDLQHKG